jgi:hypothetical protein
MRKEKLEYPKMAKFRRFLNKEEDGGAALVNVENSLLILGDCYRAVTLDFHSGISHDPDLNLVDEKHRITSKLNLIREALDVVERNSYREIEWGNAKRALDVQEEIEKKNKRNK